MKGACQNETLEMIYFTDPDTMPTGDVMALNGGVFSLIRQTQPNGSAATPIIWKMPMIAVIDPLPSPAPAKPNQCLSAFSTLTRKKPPSRKISVPTAATNVLSMRDSRMLKNCVPLSEASVQYCDFVQRISHLHAKDGSP